jgi:ATP synthase protein I
VPPDQPEDLKRLGERIEEAGRKRSNGPQTAPPTPIGIAFRFATEMVVALIVGGGIGWGIDWGFDHWTHWHTRPWGIVVLTILGAAAGIRNVFAAAREINAGMTAKDSEK